MMRLSHVDGGIVEMKDKKRWGDDILKDETLCTQEPLHTCVLSGSATIPTHSLKEPELGTGHSDPTGKDRTAVPPSARLCMRRRLSH
jgi:hypothetical protein